MIASIYGWASDERSDYHTRLERSSALVQATLDEVAQWPPCPVLLMGDFNFEFQQFPLLQQMVASDRWYDLGAKAQAWGGQNNVPTSLAHNSCKSTRIDMIFANPAALSLVRAWKNHPHGLVDVHAPISVSLSVSCPPPRPVYRMFDPLDVKAVDSNVVCQAIGACMLSVHDSMMQSLSSRDTSTFYLLWSRALEAGLAQVCRSQPDAPRGRGTPKVSLKAPSWAKAAPPSA